VKTTVQSAINLTLDKQGPGAATQNDTTTYTITVKNNKIGPTGATAFGVKIIDPLPVGLIPLNVEADPGNFTCQLAENPVNSVICNGDLETEQTVTITISAFVTLESGTLDNEACVDPDHTIAETNELDNCKHAVGQVLPPAPDLLINKSADKGSVTSGDDLTYTLSVSNVGTGDTDGTPITVTDNVPSQVSVTNISPDGGWDCSATSGNAVSCTRPSMAKGDSSNIVIATVAGATLTAPFTNTADVAGGGDAQLNNNSSSFKTTVGGAPVDLKVASVTDTPDPVNRSDKLTYTAIVRNDGTSGATGAVIRIALPNPGTSNPAVSGTNGFNCGANTTLDASGHTFDCTGDFTGNGGAIDSTTITAEVTVDTAAPDELSATVTVDPAGAIAESDETNNTETATTTVSGSVCTGSPCVDLVTTVFADPIVPAAFGVITGSASITNIGDAAVSNSPTWKIKAFYIGPGAATLIAPAGVSCPLLVANVWQCTSTAAVDPMDLGPGLGLTFQTLVAGANVPGPAIWTFQADVSSVVPEFSESNNTGVWTTTITP
jgi:uncharacterized repeat protein (TIGR01451 family)